MTRSHSTRNIFMPWTSIRHAHAEWRRHWGKVSPGFNFERAEKFILSEPPENSADAACILDVICAYEGDARCDGLDHAALKRVRCFLSNSA